VHKIDQWSDNHDWHVSAPCSSPID
jgi:hypothetical protein